MKHILHTGIATLLVLCLGYAQCTGGLLAVPYAFAGEDEVMSVAHDDQFTCFVEVLMTHAQATFSEEAAHDHDCEDGSCAETVDEDSAAAPSTAVSIPTVVPGETLLLLNNTIAVHPAKIGPSDLGWHTAHRQISTIVLLT